MSERRYLGEVRSHLANARSGGGTHQVTIPSVVSRQLPGRSLWDLYLTDEGLLYVFKGETPETSRQLISVDLPWRMDP